jgi:LuxR family maltose regulon positive regulatory protein
MGLELSEDNILSLEKRTEGWIAGLHLAALSMQDTKDLAGFISAFTGDDRYIVDYLVDEVLACRPKGTKDFLLRTSILNRMTGSLCDTVTGQEGGQELLERLDQANLFIMPLDNRRCWYRYHHLFADVLRQRLTETATPHQINMLHQRASQWYEKNDFLVEAVEHALSAEDYDNVIRLIELGSMELLMRGQQSFLLKWQAELPRELVASHPRLCMTIAWAWLSMGHTQDTEDCLLLLERSLGAEIVDMFFEQDRAEELDPAIQILLIEIAVIRIELAIEGGDIPQVFKLSQLVLPYLEDEGDSLLDSHLENLRSVVYFALGLAYKISGILGKASEALTKAAVLGRELGNVYIAAGSLGRLASVHSMQGHLRQAVRTCQQGVAYVQDLVREPPMSGLIHAELGKLLYEQNDLEAALGHLQEGIMVAKQWGFLEAFVPGYIGLARLRSTQGDWEGAFAALDELAELGAGNPAMVMPAVDSLRAYLWVSQEKVDTANHWAKNAGLDLKGEIEFHRIGEWMVFARVLIACHAYSEAIDLLTRMVDAAEAGGWFGRQIEMRVLLAIAHQKRGDNNQAMIALEQALLSAEPEGYVRVFVDEGYPMQTLLREAENQGIAPVYAPSLLAAFETDHIQVEPTSVPSPVEPLSERELEVLRLLKTELSGPEIADEMVIALSTLRTHTQNIYSKLGVSSRRAAVRKAEELNLR